MREKENYRDVYSVMIANGCPLMMTQQEVKSVLGCSIEYVQKCIKKGILKKKCGKISLASVCSMICD